MEKLQPHLVSELVHNVRLGYSLVAQMVKNPPAKAGDPGLILGSERSPWRRKWQPTPVFLPGEFYGHRNLEGYSPWGQKESDMTKQLTLPLFPELRRVAHYT